MFSSVSSSPFYSNPMLSEIFSVLHLLSRTSSSASLLLYWTQTVMLAVDGPKIERVVCAFVSLSWLVFYPDLLWTHSYIYLHSAQHWQVDQLLSFCDTTADISHKFCSATSWWLLCLTVSPKLCWWFVFEEERGYSNLFESWTQKFKSFNLCYIKWRHFTNCSSIYGWGLLGKTGAGVEV